MAGLLEGVLPAVYSYGNTMQRKLKGLLADPLGTVGLGVTRAGEDQQQLVNLAKDAGYMPGSRSVLATPQQKALAQALLAKQATDMGAGMMQAATVWHGSPHKFDRFDSSKIGTGEGAQAYGHGLYLADAKDVANAYQYNLGYKAGNVPKVGGVEIGDFYNKVSDRANRLPPAMASKEYDKLAMLEDLMGEQATPAQVLQNAAQRGYPQHAVDWFKAHVVPKYESPGSLYKVDLPDPLISRMLDWDKPLSQQAPEVRKAIDGIVEAEELYKGRYAPRFLDKRTTAGDAINVFNDALGGPSVTSNYLRQAGIPGIRYLDGGSRGAGAGTSNYVIFPGEESALTILERNGSPVNALVQALRGPR